jgi:protein involved in polysaccharide export with SLBB domain
MLLRAKIILILLFFVHISYGQDTMRNQENMGQSPVNEVNDPLSDVLKQKGISLDKIDPTNVQSTKDVIRKTIGEVNKTTGATTAYREEVVASPLEESIIIDDPRVADDIVQRLKEGSTFNEAITEELAENKIQGANEIYGQHIFVNNTIEVYRGSSTGKIPGNYVLDEGDEIAINIFGVSQADLVYQIDKDGFIRPSNIPKIYLKGVTLTKAKEIITKRFMMAYRYSRDQIAIDLKTARTISVSIFGQVTREGNYTLSALNSVLNALVLSDGLKGNGSVRNIKILSGGKERSIDIYEFLYSGEVKPEYYLKNNDIIYVPIANQVVTAKGELRRTGSFELKEGEGFKNLMLFTEGLTTSGRSENIEIVRKEQGENKLYNLDYKELFEQNYRLQDLDVITVAYEDRRMENIVFISGAVKNAGRYEWQDGMSLLELMDKGEVEDFAKLEVGYLVRKLLNGQYRIERVYPQKAKDDPKSKYNLILQKEDKLSILNQKDYIQNYSFSIQGAVKRDLKHEWAPFQTLQLSDAILMAGGMLPNATSFGYIVRKSPNNSEKFEYVFIEARKAIEDPESVYNIKISPNDRIVIPAVELFNDQLNLSISGAVRRPVSATYDPSLTLQQMVAMAGGLTYEASSNRIDVYRLEINENEPTRTLATSITINKDINEIDPTQFELMPFDQIVVRNTPEFDPIKLVNIEGEVKYPGPYAIVGDNYKLSDLIEAAGGVTDEANLKGGKILRTKESKGYIITKMHRALKRVKSDYNVILDEGDRVTVPRSESIVHIFTSSTRAAEIYTEDYLSETMNVAFKGGKRAKYYINNYVGGFAKGSKKSKTVVETKSGQIKKTRNLLLFKVYPKLEPGSTIIAFQKDPKSEKKQKIKQEKADMSVTERLMQLQTMITITTSTVTTAITSVLLVRELSR